MSKQVSGGNISGGPKGRSGNVTELKVKKTSGKNVPDEVNERRPPVRPVEQQLASMEKRYDEDQKKWLTETNFLNERIRETRRRAETGLSALRLQLDKKQEELEQANEKFEKYLMRCEELEDTIDELQK